MNAAAGRRRRQAAERAPTTPDPIEIAMEAEASGEAPSGVAAALLADQRRLIGWEIADRRAAFGLKLLAGLAAAAVMVVLGLAAWNASRASGTVIEPFDTAPSLVAQGLGGEAIASDLVARMTAIQIAAGSDRPRRQSSSAGDRINVVIPQTGVSIGEAQRMLREWLGHETHVSGALRPTPDGKLSLSLRIDGRNVPVTPPPPDQQAAPDPWIAAGAEAALRETDPYKYAVWVTNQGRLDEAAAVYRRLIRAGSPEDQAWAWFGLAGVYINQSDLVAAWQAGSSARRLAPNLDSVLPTMTNIQRVLGHDEQARFYAGEALRLGRLSKAPGRHALKVAARTVQAGIWSNDWLATTRAFETVVGLQRAGDQGYPPGLVVLYGRALARLHEPQRATLFTPDTDPLAGSQAFEMRATQLAEAGRWAEVEALATQPFHFPLYTVRLTPQLDRVVRLPWLAYAMARNGKVAAAQAVIGPTPLDCYFCLRVRGRIAALAGLPQDADRWFAEAARLGPSLADAEYEWAEAKLARGDAAGALALTQQAAAKAPGWADPNKLQGDLNLRAGQAAAAVDAYAKAATLAPRWGGLHLAWGEALAKLGKAEEARAKWRAAAGMDLTAAERLELQGRLTHG